MENMTGVATGSISGTSSAMEFKNADFDFEFESLLSQTVRKGNKLGERLVFFVFVGLIIGFFMVYSWFKLTDECLGMVSNMIFDIFWNF